MIDFLSSLAQWVATILAVIGILGVAVLGTKWFVGLIIFLWEEST